MLQNRNHQLPGVSIPLHNTIKNIMSLTGMSLALQLAHPKCPKSYIYLKKMLKEQVKNDRETPMPCFIMTILNSIKCSRFAIL